MIDFNKPFLNKREIKQAYKAGYLDLVYKQLTRYGDIIYTYDNDVSAGYYQGANRHRKINHHGLEWDIELLNGEVRCLGYKL